MSRKVVPTLVVKRVDKKRNEENSITSINNSYLHQGYMGQEVTVTRCHLCRKAGKGSLMATCDCFGRLYHQECLKKWLGNQLHNPRISVKSNQSVYQLDCEGCNFPIKFKANSKQRCRSGHEVCSYCSSHKGFTFAMVFLFGILLGMLLYMILLSFGLIHLCDCNMAKSTLLIALGVVSFFFFLIALCCLLDCLRIPDYKIQTLYDQRGHSKRSARSVNSGGSRGSSRHKLKVQTLQ